MLIVHNIFNWVIDSIMLIDFTRLLDSFYRKETNANIKERILLVKRVRYDKQ